MAEIMNNENSTMSGLEFRLLELPDHLVCDVLSRLPLKTILRCRCICKKFLQLLTEPYYSKIHLTKAPTTTASLIIRENFPNVGHFFIYMLDLDETSYAPSCSSDLHHRNVHPGHVLTRNSYDLCFRTSDATLVGSCNGLFCLYHPQLSKPVYYICNPILGEYAVISQITPSTSDYTYLNHSGFGFCPKTNRYKVIRFMSLESVDPFTGLATRKTVVEIHTLGTPSWRSIEGVPCPRTLGSFDRFLNGALHWVTNSRKTSDLIYSFDLETELFRPLPPPAHFDFDYVRNISLVNVGVLRGCLCLCYGFGDAQFEVWVMKDYGVKESWTKEFSVDIKFYCGLRVEDLYQPIKFLNNGDMWLLYQSDSLVSYSPQKGTFRDLKTLRLRTAEVIVHIPSFISLKNTAAGENLEVKNVVWKTNRAFEIPRTF